MSLQTLVDRSPFAPPQAAGESGVPQAEAGTLEFRGMVVDESGTSYSVFDATASRSHWVREGQDGPLKLKSYNAQESMLEIEQNGKPVKLQLKRATIQAGSPMITTMAQPPGMPQPNGAQMNQPGVQPQADAKRLEAVAAEVRRRRALRNAAANPGAPKPPQAQPATAAPAPANP